MYWSFLEYLGDMPIAEVTPQMVHGYLGVSSAQTVTDGIKTCVMIIATKLMQIALIEFGIPGKIIYTPGHTQGSVSVLLETGEAFVGCLAHNNLPFRFRPGLPIFAEDIEKVKESWKPIIQQGAKTIYPAHGNPFSVDIIKKALTE